MGALPAKTPLAIVWAEVHVRMKWSCFLRQLEGWVKVYSKSFLLLLVSVLLLSGGMSSFLLGVLATNRAVRCLEAVRSVR